MTDCDRAFSTYKAVKIDRTFNPMEETEIDFAFTMNGEVIAKLVLQSNTFNVGSSQISS